jgi:hypothetical protein
MSGSPATYSLIEASTKTASTTSDDCGRRTVSRIGAVARRLGNWAVGVNPTFTSPTDIAVSKRGAGQTWTAMLMRATNVNMTYVAFRSAPAVSALLGGHVTYQFAD